MKTKPEFVSLYQKAGFSAVKKKWKSNRIFYTISRNEINKSCDYLLNYNNFKKIFSNKKELTNILEINNLNDFVFNDLTNNENNTEDCNFISFLIKRSDFEFKLKYLESAIKETPSFDIFNLSKKVEKKKEISDEENEMVFKYLMSKIILKHIKDDLTFLFEESVKNNSWSIASLLLDNVKKENNCLLKTVEFNKNFLIEKNIQNSGTRVIRMSLSKAIEKNNIEALNILIKKANLPQWMITDSLGDAIIHNNLSASNILSPMADYDFIYEWINKELPQEWQNNDVSINIKNFVSEKKRKINI